STDGKGSEALLNCPYGIAIRYKIAWTPMTHALFPSVDQTTILTMLMISAKKGNGTPWHPETYFHTLPRDILFLILSFSVVRYLQNDHLFALKQLSPITTEQGLQQADINQDSDSVERNVL